jgi:sporulation protein YlmC with PRC-barrel domain
MSADASATSSDQATETVRLRPASVLIGTDLHAKDGRKVGDIVDFSIDLERSEITHLMVMTGGILTLGGDVRAVPVEAVSREGETYHLSVSKETFDQLETYDADDLAGLHGDYGAAVARAFDVGSPPPAVEGLTRYTQISMKTVEVEGGAELGNVDDMLVNLEAGEAPYFRIFAMDFPALGASTFFFVPVEDLNKVQTIEPTLERSLDDLADAPALSNLSSVETAQVDGHRIFQMETDS